MDYPIFDNIDGVIEALLNRMEFETAWLEFRMKGEEDMFYSIEVKADFDRDGVRIKVAEFFKSPDECDYEDLIDLSESETAHKIIDALVPLLEQEWQDGIAEEHTLRCLMYDYN